ncbi:tape-measure protein [Peterkaempfera bronchialis]|uniref:tape-measure protein n=1 Tax=Peterkaempfera bronchialis TaxID=2126346 RepID=UPI003C30BD86
MSTPADPLAGASEPLRRLSSRSGQATRTLRNALSGIRDAAAAADRIKDAADQSGIPLRDAKSKAEAADRSLARAGRSASGAAAGIRSAAGGAKGAKGALGKLKSGVGGVTSMLGALGTGTGPLAKLMGVFGVALTAGSLAMTAVNVAMRANPLGFALGLLVPILAYLIDLALSSETGQRIIQQVFGQTAKYLSAAFTAIGPLIEPLGGMVSSAWNRLMDAVGPVKRWITEDIPGAFKRVKDAMTRALGGMGGFITSGLQAFLGVLKGPLSGLIGFTNWVIDGLNSLSFSALGKKFGVHLTKIPMLAEGGIALPGTARQPGRVLPLDRLGGRPAVRRAHRTAAPTRIRDYHESPATGARGTAEDLLFLATAHI